MLFLVMMKKAKVRNSSSIVLLFDNELDNENKYSLFGTSDIHIFLQYNTNLRRSPYVTLSG